MKNLLWLFASVLLVAACKKTEKETLPVVTTPPVIINNDTVVIPVPVVDSFTTYTIKAGKNYMEGNTYPQWQGKEIHFLASFDSSCIYQNVDPVNQYDINKLMGYSDCSSFHQTNSARFGWNWLGDSIHIHAYCYVNGQRNYKELGTVAINTIQDCRLKVLPGSYIFELNGKADTMARGCTDDMAVGYKLYPYFGGDEPSPHDINIRIREY